MFKRNCHITIPKKKSDSEKFTQFSIYKNSQNGKKKKTLQHYFIIAIEFGEHTEYML